MKARLRTITYILILCCLLILGVIVFYGLEESFRSPALRDYETIEDAVGDAVGDAVEGDGGTESTGPKAPLDFHSETEEEY